MGFFNKVKGFISKPTETFRTVQSDTLKDALKYAIIWYVIQGVIYGLIIGFIFKIMSTLSGIPEAITDLGFLLVIIIPVLLVIFGIPIMLIFCLWQHLCVLICGGKKGYVETVKAILYGNTPSYLIGWIPYVGQLAGFIGSLIVSIIGLRELQEISTGRAIAAFLLAVVPIFLLSLIIPVIAGNY